MFNIRGSDVPHNPVSLAFAIVPATGKPELFIAPEKLDADARAHLDALSPSFPLPERSGARLQRCARPSKRVRLDPERCRLVVCAARSA